MTVFSIQRNSIKSWAEEDRPREKLLLKGKSSLSDAELLAIIIGSGSGKSSAVDVARSVLHLAKDNLVELCKLSIEELQKIKGIGEAKAIGIAASLELGRRRREAEGLRNELITTSQKAAEMMMASIGDLTHEEFWVLFLKRNNTLIEKINISIGGRSGTIVDPKVIFKYALDKSVSNIILVHNHPSGSLKPSEEDKKLTKKIKEAGNLLDIYVLDHIIVTDQAYYSFADNGLL